MPGFGVEMSGGQGAQVHGTMSDQRNAAVWIGGVGRPASAGLSRGLAGAVCPAVLCLLLAGGAGAACAKKPVVVQAPPPPLEVPVVPPRLVGPVMVAEPELPPIEEPEPAPTRPRQPRPAARVNDPVTKVEPPPDPNAKPTDGNPGQPAANTAQIEPAPLLRTPDTANDAEVSRKVREILARAGDNLNKVNYNGLNAGAKAQHDTARRFIAQAEEAVKGKNLVFARYVAEKAELLSASLLNR
jgi:hypothetical protein